MREVWDAWAERLPYLYNPGREVTVDEQLVRFRGKKKNKKGGRKEGRKKGKNKKP